MQTLSALISIEEEEEEREEEVRIRSVIPAEVDLHSVTAETQGGVEPCSSSSESRGRREVAGGVCSAGSVLTELGPAAPAAFNYVIIGDQ